MRHFGITGTPGTGKKTIAPLVARSLKIQLRSLNDVASKFGLVERNQDVDVMRLGAILRSEMKTPTLLYGHLLPYALPRTMTNRVAVLRCNPLNLKTRLLQRRYGEEKVEDNVESELIGLISAECVSKFGTGRVAEFDTTTTDPNVTAEAIVNYFTKSRHGPSIDWLASYASEGELKSLLSPATPDSFT